MKYNVYIYGAGNEYNRLSAIINMYSDKLNVLGLVTTERQLFKSIDGFACLTVDEIDVEKMDYIIIAVGKWKEISDSLIVRGIDEKYIIRSSAFFVPGFDLERYLRIKENGVTILSNYCLGGLLYNELGLKMLSPTINMFCAGKDYIEFLRGYKQYLCAEMKVYHDEKYLDGTKGIEQFYPKGILNNKVVWNFSHDADASEAVRKWNERAKRVNFDNIAAIMTIQCDEDAAAFETINIDKKIGIYHKDLGLENVICLSGWDNKEARYKMNFSWPGYVNSAMTNSRGHAAPVNWIKFLNGEKDFRRFG